MSDPTDVVAVLNPESGHGKGRRLASCLDKLLTENFGKTHLVVSENAEQVRELAKQAVMERAKCFLAIGGDGTAHYAIQSLIHSETALGILPVGSGNDLAVTLGISEDLEQAIPSLARGITTQIDVAQTRTGIYACIAGVGLDSEVNRRANARNRWIRGRALYPLAILGTLAAFRPRQVQIQCDNESFEGRIMFAVFANAPSYGRRIRIAPMATVDDGVLEVGIVKAMSKLNLLRHYPKTYRGTHIHHPFFLHMRGRRIEIHSDEPLELFGDGEYMEETPTRIEVLPRALRVLVPH